MEQANGTADHLRILQTVSLTTVLEREIEGLILSGELPPGDRINEIQLAKRFGTSRGPIREATRSLEGRGLVEVVRKRPRGRVQDAASPRRWRYTISAPLCSAWRAGCWPPA